MSGFDERERRHREALRVRKGQPHGLAGGAGRGVVLAPHGWDYHRALTFTLRMLALTTPGLPVEVWTVEPPPRIATRLDVRWRTLAAPDVAEPYNALKVQALARSDFAEAVYLDADCYPVADLAGLFAESAYQQHGTLFWTGPMGGTITAGQCRAMGIPFTSDPALLPGIIGGCLAIDRTACAAELATAAWLATQEQTFAVLRNSDECLYRAAWLLHGRATGELPLAAWTGPALVCRTASGPVAVHRGRDKDLAIDDGRLPGETARRQWLKEMDR